jgi:hypothetical protein
MKHDLEERTKRFSLAIMKFTPSLHVPQYWLELLIDSGLAKSAAVQLHTEASEPLAIFTSIRKRLGKSEIR